MASPTVQRLASLLIGCLFIITVAIRLPNVILEGGRFWAEEGVIYFHNAWYLPWYQAWFAIHTGYINFTASFATWAAMHTGGIRYAPTVTVMIALAVQCLPVYVITTHEFPWRRSIVTTALAAMMCALPPLTSEVWLNTITSQFHFGLCAALIFASPSKLPRLFFIDCAILFIGAFSGPVTCFLLPFFLVTAAISRDREALTKAAILSFGFFVQFLMYATHDTSIRGARLSIDQLLSVISLHTIILQLGGLAFANQLAGYFHATDAAHQMLWSGPLIFFVFYALLAYGIFRSRNVITARLLCAGIFISLISFYEALLGDFNSFMTLGFGERYAFVPMAINGLVVVALASMSPHPFNRIFSLILCVILLVGIADYRADETNLDHGPPWRPQFVAWRLNSNKALLVWPNEHWPTALTANHVLNATVEKNIHHMMK